MHKEMNIFYALVVASSAFLNVVEWVSQNQSLNLSCLFYFREKEEDEQIQMILQAQG